MTIGLVSDMQYDAPAPMAALAQCVGEACLAQGEDPAQRDFELSLVNQLCDGLQAFARGAGTSEKQRADAKLMRFLLRWLPRCGNQRSSPFHHWPRAFEGLCTHRVYYEIHVTDDLLKRCGGVINYHFRAQGAYKVHIGRPSGPDHLRPLPPGKLDGKRANATSSSQDQNALTGLQPATVKERLPGGRCAS